MSLYADDTVLYCFSKDSHQLERKLNEDLSNVAVWLKDNKLTLNLGKSKSMLIGSNQKLAKILQLSVSIFNCNIENVENFQYLGIKLTSDFTWSDQVEYVIFKVNQRLGLLRRIKHLLPIQARLLFSNTVVLPMFDYADLVLRDKNNATIMNDLQIMQKKAAKIISDKPLYSSATDALTTLKWLNLGQRRHYYRCLYIFKCINKLSCHSMDLPTHRDVHGYNTRHKDMIRLPVIKTTWGKQRLAYHAVKE